MPMSPDSPSAWTPAMVVVPRSAAPAVPLAYTRRRPGRSVTNMRPSGAKATSQGMIRPDCTTVSVSVGALAFGSCVTVSCIKTPSSSSQAMPSTTGRRRKV
ncbi:MAG: hypothetical protein AUH85_17570 [Chloroflexi bacterium 13_1_40CM_4_68_4]|nr:MAG: hypothetical protein AUH85_17570 [Chloroflexi bacterium 13_1_40CM_4_68_4]